MSHRLVTPRSSNNLNFIDRKLKMSNVSPKSNKSNFDKNILNRASIVQRS